MKDFVTDPHGPSVATLEKDLTAVVKKQMQISQDLNARLQLSISETRAALQRITILERQLKQFGRHSPSCEIFRSDGRCDCGWSAAAVQSL